MKTLIFWPVIALVLLTACIWVLMYVRRLAEISRSKIKPQQLKTREMAFNQLKDVSAADNFSNLLEIPVLFYVICVVLFVTDEVSRLQLLLAWCFLILRVLHSVIHITYNGVVHRWAVYLASTLCVFAMWCVFSLSLLSGVV